jgi:hypothetical protein
MSKEEAVTDPIRVVVWSTGGVGSVAVDGIRHRPDLKLVGVWVHSPDKVGKDAGELVGGAPIGLAATNDADALIALKPDCVVYAASGPQRDAGAVPDYLKLLAAGINVVSTSTTSLVYPPSYFATEWRDQLAAAAHTGGASFYASGIFPGFASDQLALLMTTQSKKICTLTATEIALNDHYPVADIMINGMGFARPLDFEPMLKTPGFIEIAWKAPIHLIADGLGVEVEEIRGSLDRELTDRDIEVAFGTVPAGTCGAVRTRAAGVVGARGDRDGAHHPDGTRRRPELADFRGRRHLPGRHRGRSRHSLRDDSGRRSRAWRRSRSDGRDRDAGRERRALRGGRAGRAAQFAGHSETFPRHVFQ